MPQVYVAGAVEIWVGVSEGGSINDTPVLLGHCERTPVVQIRPHYTPVFSDYTGHAVPADLIYDAEEAFIVLDLTRYSEAVYVMLAKRTGRGNKLDNKNVRGSDGPDDFGKLMIRDRCTREMWIRFPFSNKAIFGSPGVAQLAGLAGGVAGALAGGGLGAALGAAAGGGIGTNQGSVSSINNGPLPAGYHFYATYLEGPDDLGPLNTTARRLRLHFHCLRRGKHRQPQSFTRNDTMQLYDHDMSKLAGKLGQFA